MRSKSIPFIFSCLSLSTLICLTFSVKAMQTNWQFKADGMIAGQPTVHNNVVYVTGGRYVYALNLKGQQLWSYDTDSDVRSSVAIADGKAIFNAEDGLYALDLMGKRQWFYPSQDSVNFVNGKTYGWEDRAYSDDFDLYRSSPVVSDGVVFFGNAQGTHAIDVGTGKPIWTIDTGVTHTTPAIEGETLVIGSWNNSLYGINTSDGNVKWQLQAELPRDTNWEGWKGFHLSPVIQKNVAYVGARGTYFYAVNIESGKVIWSTKVGATWIGSPALVDGDYVHYGLSDGYSLVSRQTRSGNPTDVFDTRFYNFAQPQADHKSIYVASMGGELFAIDKTSGKGKRIFVTEQSQKNLKRLMGEHGGYSYPISAKQGFSHENFKQDIHTMLNELGSLLSITVSNGVIYVGSATGVLYAVPLNG